MQKKQEWFWQLKISKKLSTAKKLGSNCSSQLHCSTHFSDFQKSVSNLNNPFQVAKSELYYMDFCCCFLMLCYTFGGILSISDYFFLASQGHIVRSFSCRDVSSFINGLFSREWQIPSAEECYHLQNFLFENCNWQENLRSVPIFCRFVPLKDHLYECGLSLV